jgi:hypothetical protein
LIARRWLEALPLVALLLVGGGCHPRLDRGAPDRLECIVPLRQGVCADSRFLDEQRCRLYGWDGRVLDGWSRQPDPHPGRPLLCPSGTVALQIPGRSADAAASRPPVLVCPAPAGQSCPTRPEGSVVECALASAAGRVTLGQGITAASLASDGTRAAAVWGASMTAGPDGGAGDPAPADGSMALRWQLLDGQLAALPTAPRGVPTTGACNALNGHDGLDGVTLWSTPRLTDDGGAEVMALGVCTRDVARVGQRVRFSASEATAQATCIDVGSHLAGMEVSAGQDGPPLLALSIDCSTGESAPGFHCPGDGPLVVPLDQAETMFCDGPTPPLLAPARGEAVRWVGAASPGSGGPGTPPDFGVLAAQRVAVGRPGQVEVSLLFFGGPVPLVTLGDALPGAAVAFDSGPLSAVREPAMTFEDRTVALAWADPVAGILTWRIDHDGMGWRPPVDATLYAPTQGQPGLPLPAANVRAPSLAVARGGGPDAALVGCYPAESRRGLGITVQNLGFIADGKDVAFFINDPPVVGAELTCAVSSVPARCVGQLPDFLFLETFENAPGRRRMGLLSASFAVGDAGGSSRANFDLPDTPAAQVERLQLVSTHDDVVALAGLIDGRQRAFRLSTPDPCSIRGASFELLATLEAGSFQGTPRLTRQRSSDGTERALISVVDAAGNARLLEPLRCSGDCPAQAWTELGSGQPGDQVAVVGSGEALMPLRAGTLRGPGPVGAGDGEAAPSSAWVATTESTLRVVSRLPQSVGAPSLLSTPEGRRLVAFGPGAGLLALPGISVARADAAPEEQAVIAELRPAEAVSQVALGNAYGKGDDERVLVVYTTPDPGKVGLIDVATTATAAVSPPAGPVSLTVEPPGVGAAAGSTSAAAGGPSLIPLGPGMVGLSYCYPVGQEVRRLLVPLDLSGQPLGRPLDLGVQAAMAPQLEGGETTPAPVRCPNGTLVWHGPRLLSSSTQGGQVQVDEVSCTERRWSWPASR